MTNINTLLNQTSRNNASDLHLSSYNIPTIRLNGNLVQLDEAQLSNQQIADILKIIMTEQQHKKYEEDNELDFAIGLDNVTRFRVNAFQTIRGPAAVFRTIPSKIPTVEELGLPNIVKRFASINKGLILVTGPTGSGKTTTLASMINYINENHSKHIITVEDPVEYIHDPKESLVSQRELGTHTHSFSRALKSALREDPDVILVGELRDTETIHLALTAAETGHLVLGTLHTVTAAKSIDRILDAFPASERSMINSMLSTSLEAVISQQLIKTKDEQSRVAALEIMIANPAIRNMIRDGKVPQIESIMQISSQQGMVLMRDSIINMLSKDLLDEESARAALNIALDVDDDSDRSTSEIIDALIQGKQANIATSSQAKNVAKQNTDF